MTNNGDGTYKALYQPTEEGPHQFVVNYEGAPVPGSPFKMNAVKGCDPKKVKAYGPGLEQGMINETNHFTVETLGAGVGGLNLAVEGPAEAKMTCKDNRNGTCSVEYVPVEPGDHAITVKFGGEHIPGSPFKVPVGAPADENRVKAFGPGVDPEQCRAGPPLKFKGKPIMIDSWPPEAKSDLKC